MEKAFLNGEIDMPNVFVRQPPFCEDPAHPNRVWKLRKGLYGTKQGGHIWYKKFKNHLVSNMGLIPHDDADPCLFTTVNKKGKLTSVSSIYVDDAIVGGPGDIPDKVIKEIGEEFSTKDLGVSKHVIGIQVEQMDEGTLLTQVAYIDEIIKMTGQTQSNVCYVPMSSEDPSYSMIKDEGNKDNPIFTPLDSKEHHLYREYIGKLMYLMVCTRPDIAFAVNFLARAVATPQRQHMMLVIKLVRYLKGTRKLGIFYPIRTDEKSEIEVVGYVDSAFADCLESRKSTSGYIFCINGAPLTWRSSSQTVVTTSTAEAEYVAVCDVVKEAIWVSKLLERMCIKTLPITLLEDSNGCIAMTANPLNHKRTKHIDVKFHFTCQMVEDNKV